jgi:hypothetical protein
MHSLLSVDEYYIKQLIKKKCWACQEGLAGTNSMHDCEQDFNMIFDYFSMKLRFL